jgi:multiple sugar transport system substrate-binding protein/raffinose/stachyose/melibiose transport system substrate-binding protein
MAGQAAYTDPEVEKAMQTWKTLLDKGYFIKDPNAYDWNEASDMVANGKAGMTLMGTWIAGYLDGLGLKPAEDYDFFPFPVITPGLTEVTHGTVDGWVIPKGSKNIPGAEGLILHMLTPENQALWSKAQGALAAISNVPEGTYSAAQQHAADFLAKVQFNSGYDLSTTPPMAEGGLNMFAQFVHDPSKYQEYLQQTEEVAKEVFKK